MRVLLASSFASSVEKKAVSIEKHPLATDVTLIPAEYRCLSGSLCLFSVVMTSATW